MGVLKWLLAEMFLNSERLSTRTSWLLFVLLVPFLWVRSAKATWLIDQLITSAALISISSRHADVRLLLTISDLSSYQVIFISRLVFPRVIPKVECFSWLFNKKQTVFSFCSWFPWLKSTPNVLFIEPEFAMHGLLGWNMSSFLSFRA